jgi:aerobic carbon-monoxide dehydrogenase large subunit
VQGIAQALFEHAVYDTQGQLLSGSFMDYVHFARTTCRQWDCGFHHVPCVINPLGIKGAAKRAPSERLRRL